MLTLTHCMLALARAGPPGCASWPHLGLDACSQSLAAHRGSALHVLVAGVGAGADEASLELSRPAVLLDGLAELQHSCFSAAAIVFVSRAAAPVWACTSLYQMCPDRLAQSVVGIRGSDKPQQSAVADGEWSSNSSASAASSCGALQSMQGLVCCAVAFEDRPAHG